MRILLFFILFFSILSTQAQDTLIIDETYSNLNHSIADQFTLLEAPKQDTENSLKTENAIEIQHSIANLDFTTKTFLIQFVVRNSTTKDLHLLLETARPITNTVRLSNETLNKNFYSGDAVPFHKKDIQSNRSILPLHIPAGKDQLYSLYIGSDGEALTLPMIFWNKERFESVSGKQQFFSGIFYGIFVFVIIIYFTFYILLKDKLFLLYTVYVFLSGLLQFALDGYVHQYIFPSGGFLTQHSVIVIAGLAVFFALHYAMRYLELQGRLRTITLSFTGLVALTIFASLIPGKLYEITYPLINAFSLLAVIFLLIIGFRIRKRNHKISRLFLLGLFTLLAGAIIFILGNFSIIDAPWITERSLKAGTLTEIICLSILMAGKYKSLQEEKEAAQRQLVLELEEKNQLVSQINTRLKKEVKKGIKEIEENRILLKRKNDDFVASIKYAQRIQKALLSNEQKFQSLLPESFILSRPKDIVSGDFYWIEQIPPTEQWPSGLTVYATADCTGHGVPGAFVSIICNNLLELGKTNKEVQSTGDVLDFVNKEINTTLNSEYAYEQIRDGMDIALCAIDHSEKMLYFSGAKNGVYVIRENELIELKADRRGIGYSDNEVETPFRTQSMPLQPGDLLYTFSDGFIDQFGGPKGKKFTSKRLKEVLISISESPMSHQLSTLENTFDLWKEYEEQIDDVLLIGVRIS